MLDRHIYFRAILRICVPTAIRIYIQNSDLIYQVPTSALYAKNLATLTPSQKYGSGDYGSIDAAVWEEELTAEEYFLGHQDFFKGCAW